MSEFKKTGNYIFLTFSTNNQEKEIYLINKYGQILQKNTQKLRNNEKCWEFIRIGSDKNCEIVLNEENYKIPTDNVLFYIHFEDCKHFAFGKKLIFFPDFKKEEKIKNYIFPLLFYLKSKKFLIFL